MVNTAGVAYLFDMKVLCERSLKLHFYVRAIVGFVPDSIRAVVDEAY
jgi:hypothetical protein